MNTTMADGASERLDAQIADALFGQPGMGKLDVANRLRELRGAGLPLLADAGIPVLLSPTGEPNTARNRLTETAQAMDLRPATIPDTPEVRGILGRPNSWCSPWANVLRMRGDAIPCRAEEEQAAVIRFMLNHYLANGTAWAETAGAELEAIRKADSEAVGNG
ncbi:hypothetical protein [Stenotrophomonas sp.]|uniref:hypothetical protein n=1 Tax=Stenotrophomonas sp. TaxID=69392 RepID=UPI0028AFD177|nr:hypothetical protein [Stenotrophomonas sp.]